MHIRRPCLSSPIAGLHVGLAGLVLLSLTSSACGDASTNTTPDVPVADAVDSTDGDDETTSGCSINDDCEAGEVCTAEGCTRACVNDAGCDAASYCDGASRTCLPRGCTYATDCLTGDRCEAFQCEPFVPTPCQANTASCDDAARAVRGCGADGQATPQVICGDNQRCVANDDNAACTAVICEANSSGCVDADTAFNCNGTGTAQNETPCGEGSVCEAGVCQPLICTPATTRCRGTEVLSCDEHGTSEAPESCAETAECLANAFGCGCTEGACKPLVCVPGTTRCAGAGFQTCADDGLSWLAEVPCNGGETCDAGVGACVAPGCTPDATECFGTLLATCDNEGLTRQTIDCAANDTVCTTDGGPARCAPRLCEPFSVTCDATFSSVVTCDGRGMARTTTPCEAPGFCALGECHTGTRRCPIAVITSNTNSEIIPGMTVNLSAAASVAFDSTINHWEWSVVGPEGNTGSFHPSAARQEVSFLVESVGVHVFSLSVRDANGVESCEVATHTVHVTSDEAIRVELYWHNPTDPDETDTGYDEFGEYVGADLDLHFLHPNAAGQWFDTAYDCFWANGNPVWRTGAIDEVPLLIRDDYDGAGPEVIGLIQPQAGNTYRVGVHYWEASRYGTARATVRVYIHGDLRAEWSGVELVMQDLWDVLTISWPSQTIDRVLIDGAPSITSNFGPESQF